MHNMKHGLAVIGTDTGVGKTLITARLCLAARQLGIDCVPMKPVQTGAHRMPDGRLPSPDLEWILAVLGLNPLSEDRNRMNPYTFEMAASPHLAAEMSGEIPDRRRILEAYDELSAGHDATIVEGAGGLMVPFGRDWMLADLLVDLNLPVVVVARAGLGTLNHTLLTLEAIRTRGLTVAGVILNQLSSNRMEVIETDNVRVLQELGDVPVWGTMPYWDDLDDKTEPDIVRRWLMSQIPELSRQVSLYLLK
jgi:dethiobiotin synthetase